MKVILIQLLLRDDAKVRSSCSSLCPTKRKFTEMFGPGFFNFTSVLPVCKSHLLSLFTSSSKTTIPQRIANSGLILILMVALTVNSSSLILCNRTILPYVTLRTSCNSLLYRQTVIQGQIKPWGMLLGMQPCHLC